MQPDNSKFSINGTEGTDFLGNINWNLDYPLLNASFNDVQLNEQLKQELNQIYLTPATREVIISVPSLIVAPKAGKRGTLMFRGRQDFVFTVPDNWQYGMNLWQLLQGIENFITWAKTHDRNYLLDEYFGGFYIDNIRPNYISLHTWH